jgi:amylosucrase
LLNVVPLRHMGFFQHDLVQDLYTGETLSIARDNIVIPALSFYWFQT